MTTSPALTLSHREARAVMLAAQGLLDEPNGTIGHRVALETVERLGAVQLDAINVVARTQYLVLWSRLGVHERSLLDELLCPERSTFEYWSHAASIVPMADYRYYRPRMLDAERQLWVGLRRWMEEHPHVLESTLATVRERGPMTSAEFERPPDARRAHAWDWYGPKASRRALEVLWTTGDLMVHSRRSGQKVYDVRERVLAEALKAVPTDGDLPGPEEQLRYFVSRTVRALGVTTLGWLPDYFRLPAPKGGPARRTLVSRLMADLVSEGLVVPARVEGLKEPAYLAVDRLPDLERLRHGYEPQRTTLISPFDSLIWDRARAHDLFDYEVAFEAYVVPERRRYGYYCLAVLHRGQLVGRVDPKLDRQEGRLHVRSVYLQPGVEPDAALVAGLATALQSLATFLGAPTVSVERSEPEVVVPRLRDHLEGVGV
ncbi:MAG: winged helix DNA-binding domain-containing protein [Chloroflexota bacterium]|nr:winged helix DNA-binding domain-containing protein [Chloroflexota bacterium]